METTESSADSIVKVDPVQGLDLKTGSKSDHAPEAEAMDMSESPPTPPPDDLTCSESDQVIVDSSSEGGGQTPEPVKLHANPEQMKFKIDGIVGGGGKKGGRGRGGGGNTPGPKPNRSRAPPPLNTLSAIRGPPLSSAAARKIMWDQYQPWVMGTYGDAAKTKTITTKKYGRIVALLRTLGGSVAPPPSLDKDGNVMVAENLAPVGSSSEAAKFKLWVKSKGFHLGPPPGHPDQGLPHTVDMLYLPTGTDKAIDGKVHFVYKKVAMVEQFFDIIYSVHVEAAGDTQIRGRAGKHCGQKRTYRAVADQYAFIPREAISKFLLYCIDCQRKNSLESHGGGRPPKKEKDVNGFESDTATAESGQSPPLTMSPLLPHSHSNGNGSSNVTNAATLAGMGRSSSNSAKMMNPTAALQLSQTLAAMHSLRSMQQARTSLLAAHSGSQFLATQAALLQGTHPAHPASVFLNNSLQQQGGSQAALLQEAHPASVFLNNSLQQKKINTNGQDIDLSLPITSTYLRRMRAFGLGFDSQHYQTQKHQHHGFEPPSNNDKSENEDISENKKDDGENNASTTTWTGYSNGSSPGVTGHLAGLLGQNGNSSSAALSSDQTPENSCPDDASSNGAKDDDEDEDDDDDKLDGITCGDPEKLKAFNMFVRLFVDENLDRHVPISKQPKEKIQAIIDSCTRQFPEYASRARKRIRTYLKSCRRTKRSREQAGLDGSNARPTPPHLTSVQAEQLLARACENESENAKRMRMGLEPISQPMPMFTSTPSIVDVLASSGTHSASSATSMAASLFPNMSSVTTEANKPTPPVMKTDYKPEQLASLLQAAASQNSSSTTLTSVLTSSNPQQQQPLTVTPASGGFPNLNGTSLYRQSFGQSNGNATFPPTAALLQNQSPTLQNGPSMDSLKKQPLLNHKLNATEIGAVRQLVTGYRESAAFLLRSADELEHLLQIQPKL